ncbi:3-hydroxyacyl-CoA dehydrogenase type-2-like [Paramacrobiotus metropolitanus]|uniref:3-hydroxyacyl-CoA dehydrogenase type-2-like n=1 Tax=Paramacrobiotus metropolitanus TaxID=2943436 RepID=UPI0024461AFB|nr:3-hydroxyacyl-CoA dehydrogenase type-2-like [Paramacrobiotus metropolitanus]
MNGTLTGAVAIVTGGASGLGKACVDLLAARDVRVISVDFSYTERAVATDAPIVLYPADVSSEGDIQNLIAYVAETYGRLDIIVNCAGICLTQPVYDFTTDTPHSLSDFAKMLQVNTIGTFNVIRLGVGLMSRNQPNTDGARGVIINVASSLGLESGPGVVGYGGSKAAIIGMTLGYAREFSPVGIRVATISPGMMRTPMLKEQYLARATEIALFPRRPGHPDEFAHLVQAIIENPLINGEVIRLDTGSRYPQGL